MKRIVFSLAVICVMIMFVACGNSHSFKITGTIEGANDKDTLILTHALKTGVILDTILVKDGKFSYTGHADSLQLCLIFLKRETSINSVFFIEPGEIKMRLSPDHDRCRAEGTPANDQWKLLNDSVDNYGNAINLMVTALYDDKSLSLEEKSDSVQSLVQDKYREMNQCIVGFAERNITNEFGLFLLQYYGDDVIDSLQRQRLVQMMPKKLANRLKNTAQ